MPPIRHVDLQLRRDVRLLGRLLGEVLIEQEGQSLFDLEERVRRLSIERRRGPKSGRRAAATQLAALLREMPLGQAEPVLRAFSTYFRLVNLAEQNHRIRRTRERANRGGQEPQRGSLEAVMQSLRQAGIPASRVREMLMSMRVTLTLTAHPTQASRRTVLEKTYRLARLLEERDRCHLTPREKADSHVAMREEIASLWQTDELRRERPTVGDEVKNALWYVEEVLGEQLSLMPETLDWAFERAYGEPLGVLATPVRLHSWVGGDMDGNPLVTPDVLADTLRAHRARGLRALGRQVAQLGWVLTQSERHSFVSKELRASLEKDAADLPEVMARYGSRTEGEPWRRKLRFIEARLQAALVYVEGRRAGRTEPLAPAAYRSPMEMLADLEIIERSLVEAKARQA
ncbi:MAG TPA: phosphoenolpyruvate carboxylase, partial [Myxococcaceae bacterium]|nr:phosphoenolpyruvate carboxylase [Myxococcaceae bacterium]